MTSRPRRSTAGGSGSGTGAGITRTRSTSAAAELQQLLLATEDVTEFLHQLARLTVSTLDGDLWCGITLRRDRHPITVASSDARADRVDEVQYEHDQGPCLSSLDTGEVVEIDDLVHDERWTDYRPGALAHGVRASLSLPLRSGGAVLGVLNVYAGRPHAFGAEQRGRAERFAAEASGALALAVRIAERTEVSTQLEEALASRAVVDQALGIVMAQRRCTADEAFETLRAISQNSNTKLREVAAGIVAAVSGQRAPDGARFSRGPASAPPTS